MGGEVVVVVVVGAAVVVVVGGLVVLVVVGAVVVLVVVGAAVVVVVSAGAVVVDMDVVVRGAAVLGGADPVLTDSPSQPARRRKATAVTRTKREGRLRLRQ